MLRKLKWQIPGEHLEAQYNWCQGPLPGRGPEVEKHWYNPYNADIVFGQRDTVLLFYVGSSTAQKWNVLSHTYKKIIRAYKLLKEDIVTKGL